jgi:hypothetical protein
MKDKDNGNQHLPRDEYLAYQRNAGKFIGKNGIVVFQPNAGDVFFAHQLRWIGNELNRINGENKPSDAGLNAYKHGEKK